MVWGTFFIDLREFFHKKSNSLSSTILEIHSRQLRQKISLQPSASGPTAPKPFELRSQNFNLLIPSHGKIFYFKSTLYKKSTMCQEFKIQNNFEKFRVFDAPCKCSVLLLQKVEQKFGTIVRMYVCNSCEALYQKMKL
jgi:hypothetical protein